MKCDAEEALKQSIGSVEDWYRKIVGKGQYAGASDMNSFNTARTRMEVCLKILRNKGHDLQEFLFHHNEHVRSAAKDILNEANISKRS